MLRPFSTRASSVSASQRRKQHEDPKLHEMLVEMLWRGLRRQDDGWGHPTEREGRPFRRRRKTRHAEGPKVVVGGGKSSCSS